MGEFAKTLADPAIIAQLISTGASGVSGAITPEAVERYVHREKDGGRIDEAQARQTGGILRGAWDRQASLPDPYVGFSNPIQTGPGVRSRTANLFLPMTQGGYRTSGGVSLNALPQRPRGSVPYNPYAYDPTGGNYGNGNYDPLNEVPPWGVGDNVNPVGINDEQETIRQVTQRETQDDISRILENLNNDPNNAGNWVNRRNGVLETGGTPWFPGAKNLPEGWDKGIPAKTSSLDPGLWGGDYWNKPPEEGAWKGLGEREGDPDERAFEQEILEGGEAPGGHFRYSG